MDIIFIVGIVFAIFIGYLFGYKIFDQLTIGMNETGALTNDSMQMMIENKASYVSVFDSSFVLIFVGLQVSLLISALFIRSHPVYFVLAIFFIAVFGFFSFYLSNLADDIGIADELVGYYDQFVYMKYIMQYLPIIEIIFGFVVLVILYGKGEYE